MSQKACEQLLFLDLQTSGSSAKTDSIIELAWAVIDKDGNSVLESSLIKLRSSDSLKPRISKLTGIREDDLLSAPSLSDVIQQIKNSLNLKTNTTKLVIHYAQFEMSFIRELELCCEFDLVCTYKLSGKLWPELPSKSLRAVAGYLGFETDGLKRAKHHLEATLWIWNEATKKTGLSFKGLQALSLEKTRPVKVKKLFNISAEKRLTIPKSAGVYKFIGPGNRILYIGKATNLNSRFNSYFRGRKGKGSRLNEMLSIACDFSYDILPSALEAAIIEQSLIKKYKPLYNKALKSFTGDLCFYNSQLHQVKADSKDYFYGPFRSNREVEDFKLLLEAIQGSSLEYFDKFEDLSQKLVKKSIKEWRSYFNMEDDISFFRKICIHLYKDKLVDLVEQAEDEEGNVDELDADIELYELENVWCLEDLLLHIDRKFASMYLHVKRARKLMALSNCRLIWKESVQQKSFFSVTIDYEKFSFTENDSKGESYSSKPLKKREHSLAVSHASYDQSIVLDLEIQRLIRKNLEFYLYINGKCLSREETIKYLYPLKAIKMGIIC